MNIALDYDGTYTNEPNMWLRFVLDAQSHGHNVYIVTMRYPSETNPLQFDERLRALGCRVIATSRKAKRPACQEAGVKIHIWVDDNPEAVYKDASQIWPDSTAAEGSPVDPQHDAV